MQMAQKVQELSDLAASDFASGETRRVSLKSEIKGIRNSSSLCFGMPAVSQATLKF